MHAADGHMKSAAGHINASKLDVFTSIFILLYVPFSQDKGVSGQRARSALYMKFIFVQRFPQKKTPLGQISF